MKNISEEAYQALTQQAEVLEADGFGDKVLRLNDGNFIKLFRRKRLLSSAAIWPYAQRFAINARKLAEKGIASPSIIAVYRHKELQRDLVHYIPLQGLTLRQLRSAPQTPTAELLNQLGGFIATLHNSGIYFRSVHLGNIVLTPEGELGLIDIADLKIKKRSLNKWLRLRNLKHMLRDELDRSWLEDKKSGAFIEGYRKKSNCLKIKELESSLQPHEQTKKHN